MPNRILRESDVLANEPLDELGPEGIVLWHRLMHNADDFGRFEARPRYVRSQCYRGDPPWAPTVERVGELLQQMHDLGLIQLYTDPTTGKPALQMGREFTEPNKPRAQKPRYGEPPARPKQSHMLADDVQPHSNGEEMRPVFGSRLSVSGLPVSDSRSSSSGPGEDEDDALPFVLKDAGRKLLKRDLLPDECLQASGLLSAGVPLEHIVACVHAVRKYIEDGGGGVTAPWPAAMAHARLTPVDGDVTWNKARVKPQPVVVDRSFQRLLDQRQQYADLNREPSPEEVARHREVSARDREEIRAYLTEKAADESAPEVSRAFAREQLAKMGEP